MLRQFIVAVAIGSSLVGGMSPCNMERCNVCLTVTRSTNERLFRFKQQCRILLGVPKCCQPYLGATGALMPVRRNIANNLDTLASEKTTSFAVTLFWCAVGSSVLLIVLALIFWYTFTQSRFGIQSV